MRQLLVVGNWKMNGSRASVQALLSDVVRAAQSFRPQVVVCPTYVHLAQALEKCAATSISVGAQDCSHRQSGAYTGEVAPGMLAEIGCRWVILGHSERRQYHGESDALVAAKLTAAVEAGLQPIVCVGETREQRDTGSAEAVVKAQLNCALADQADLRTLVIAYEPVWAIGTGLTATPEQASCHDDKIPHQRLMPAILCSGRTYGARTSCASRVSRKPTRSSGDSTATNAA